MTRRRVLTTASVLVVALVAAAVWFGARPWWQERRLVAALEDVEHVTAVTDLPADRFSRSVGVVLDDRLTADELARTVDGVRAAARDHRVDGDERSVWAVVEGGTPVPLDPPGAPLVAVAQVVAEVPGLTVTQAGPGDLRVRARSDARLPTDTVALLRALAGARLDPAVSGTLPRVAVQTDDTYLWLSAAGAAEQLALLEPTARAMSAAGATLRPGFSPDRPNWLDGSRPSAASCHLLVSVPPERRRDAEPLLRTGCSVALAGPVAPAAG
jgi:hypothetical protein